MAKTNKTPLIRIAKRAQLPWYKAWAIRLGAVLLALILCGLITTITTGLNPLKVYATMIDGNFGTKRRIWVLLQNMAVLLCMSLAVTPAFKMRFWNIGAEGQTLMGVLGSSIIMITFKDSMSSGLMIFLSLVTSILFGAIWGAIPALCKAKWNTNETLFTLMMNYVAMQLVNYFVILWENPAGSGKVGIINQSSRNGWLPEIAGNEFLLNILIVLVVTVVIYVYLTYTKHGYEISVVGESERTARYVGIKVGKVIVRTMVLSGAICGLTGFLLVTGTAHTISSALAGGRGFTAVMVSWLAKFNPFTMILTSGLLVFLDRGAGEIASVFGLNVAFSDILAGIIIFFIIGSEFFIDYEIHVGRHKEQNSVQDKAEAPKS